MNKANKEVVIGETRFFNIFAGENCDCDIAFLPMNNILLYPRSQCVNQKSGTACFDMLQYDSAVIQLIRLRN
jgi:hypothetical protein